MTSLAAVPRQHVLLVGIDAYTAVTPLGGCVNDTDALEAILIDRLSVPHHSITRLTSPHSWHRRSPRTPEKTATSENLRAALEELASEVVRSGDHVLIHYSGHGTQVLPRHARVPREALLPANALDGGELLFDYELNALLGRIARRSGDLTVLLDCCCSAGATRDALQPGDSAVRFCEIDGFRMPFESIPARDGGQGWRDWDEGSCGMFSSLEPNDPGYLVAAACQSNEQAREGRAGNGQRHGAFTAALLDVLAGYPAEHLAAVRWADVWQAVRERVSTLWPGQHPWLIGRPERRLFGGPFTPQDAGFPLSQAGGKLVIHGGTMVGLTVGARVAVYGPFPAFFPPIGSDEELAARLAVLRVDTATRSSCTASPIGVTPPGVEGARGRLIEAGEHDALVVQLDPWDEALASWLEGEARFRVVRRDVAAKELEEAFTGIWGDGQRWIGDEIHGSSNEPGWAGEAPLCRVSAGDRDALLLGLLHYWRYCLPLRLVQRCHDLPGALSVRLLDCANVSSLSGADLQDPALPEVTADPEHRYRYAMPHGQSVCVVVENRSTERLYVNLVNCATSGRVEVLGAAQLEVPARRRQTFWLRGQLGLPFLCRVPAGRASAVDRLVAVGTSVPDVDLSYLCVKETFEEAIRSRNRDLVPGECEPSEVWTATQITMRMVRSSTAT